MTKTKAFHWAQAAIGAAILAVAGAALARAAAAEALDSVRDRDAGWLLLFLSVWGLAMLCVAVWADWGIWKRIREERRLRAENHR